MFTFSRCCRLSSPDLFRQLIRSKNKISDIYFDIYILPNTQVCGRIGFSIPKASILKATERNRVKRVGREFFRCNKAKGLDVLFVAKKYISELSNQEIVEKLKRAWETIKDFLPN